MNTNQRQTVIKLTRPDLTTYGGYQYVLEQEHTFPGTGPLCGPGWSHAYLTQPLAELLNPTHAAFDPYHVYEAEAVVGANDNNLKVGCSSIRLVRRLDILNPTTEQRIAFAIAAASHIDRSANFRKWSEGWLSGKDRTSGTAWAREATEAATWAREATEAATWAAAWAAKASWAREASWATEAAALAAARAAARAASRAQSTLFVIQAAQWATSLQDTSCISLPDWDDI